MADTKKKALINRRDVAKKAVIATHQTPLAAPSVSSEGRLNLKAKALPNLNLAKRGMLNLKAKSMHASFKAKSALRAKGI